MKARQRSALARRRRPCKPRPRYQRPRIGCVGIFDRALTDAEIAEIERYLATHFGPEIAGTFIDETGEASPHYYRQIAEASKAAR